MLVDLHNERAGLLQRLVQMQGQLQHQLAQAYATLEASVHAIDDCQRRLAEIDSLTARLSKVDAGTLSRGVPDEALCYLSERKTCLSEQIARAQTTASSARAAIPAINRSLAEVLRRIIDFMPEGGGNA